MKKCIKCKKNLSLENFNKKSKNKDGLDNKCKECVSLYMRSRKLTSKQKARKKETLKQWKKDNKEYYKEYQFFYSLKKRYGVSKEQYLKMFKTQKESCAICKSKEHGGRNWHMDHCHTTGLMRGILCHPCNLGIGNFKDNIDNIKESIKYLKKYSNKHEKELK